MEIIKRAFRLGESEVAFNYCFETKPLLQDFVPFLFSSGNFVGIDRSGNVYPDKLPERFVSW